jgi:hypothetical protein
MLSLAFLFCSGLHVYSDDMIHHCLVELNADISDAGNSFTSDIDFFDDDQINHIDEVNSEIESVIQIKGPKTSFLLLPFCTYVWQPPKTS